MRKRTSKRMMVVSTMMMVIMTFMVSSCGEDKPMPGRPSPRPIDGTTLVMEYAELYNLSPLKDVLDYRAIVLDGTERRIFSAYNDSYCHDSGDSYPSEGMGFWLKKENNDTSFVSDVPYYDVMFHNMYLQRAWAEDIIDVEVKAITDYNEQYPAGSSLSDIAYFTYTTLYPFVQEGYIFNERSIGNGVHPLITDAYSGDELFDPFETTEMEVILRALPNYVIFHTKVAGICKNPLKMVGCHQNNLGCVSLIQAPQQQCRVEVAVTVQLRGGKYSARTYKAECVVDKIK